MHKMKTTHVPIQIDLSYMNAATVVLPTNTHKIQIVLVGCGGTGSYLAENIARLIRVLKDAGLEASATFIDPDLVEDGNVPRSRFCEAEIGLPKALALAGRYNAAWNLDITAIVDPFDPAKFPTHYRSLLVVVGAVDNHAARISIAKTLDRQAPGQAATTWVIDCGNAFQSGQVLVGSASTPKHLRGAFPAPTICTALPSPYLQEPQLLAPAPKPKVTRPASCMELMIGGQQSLNVNQRVAAEASDYLTRLVLTHDLKRFASYFNLSTGNSHSLYVTPEAVATASRFPERSLLAAA
jgi:PRTRC genetic system ThiF family protein